MAARPAPKLLLLLLLALLLPSQTCAEPTESAPTATPAPAGNASSRSSTLPGIELKAGGPRPAPGLLALMAPLGLRLVLG